MVFLFFAFNEGGCVHAGLCKCACVCLFVCMYEYVKGMYVDQISQDNEQTSSLYKG